MPKNQSQKKQVLVLCVLLVGFACMTGYSFLGRLDIPTEKSLARLRSRLTDKQIELQKAEEDHAQYVETLERIQRKHALLKYNPSLEREAIAKLDRILDDSNVTKTKSSVNVQQNRGKSNLQQVNINLEFDDISMRKMADLFETFGMKSLSGTAPLYWTRLTFTTKVIRQRNNVRNRRPGQPPAVPQQATERRQLDVAATVTSYSLFPSASDLVFAEDTKQKSSGRVTQQGGRNASTGANIRSGKKTTPAKGGRK